MNRPFHHVYTWIGSQVSPEDARWVRSMAHAWGITSKLRREAGTSHLVFASPTPEGLRFARDVYEGQIAIQALPMSRVPSALLEVTQNLKRPFSHIALGIVDDDQVAQFPNGHA